MGVKFFIRIAVLSLTFSALFLTVSAAQDCTDIRLGTFHSPKGFGVCAEIQGESQSFDAFTFDLDMFGVFLGKYSRPGYKFTYTRNIIINSIDRGDSILDFYGGPGLTAGYARDIKKSYSTIAGLSGVLGMRYLFNSSISINMELGADLAFSLNRNDRYNKNDLSLYRAGLLHFFYPQIRIQWAIR